MPSAASKPTLRNAPFMTTETLLNHLLQPSLDRTLPAARVAGRSATGDPHELPHPATGATFARVGWAEAARVDEAVAAAEDAFAGWAATPPRERAAALRAIAEI